MEGRRLKTILKRHAKMLFDLERTLPLLKAIQKKVRAGDVVVDLGCGLGVLSMAACSAGAKRVYAIDCDSEALEFAKWQAKKLKLDKKICFLLDHSYNIDLIEKADLLIQETIGPLAFDENFLPTLLDAKNRFLKRGAKIIPEEVYLYGAPSTQDKKLLHKPTRLIQIKTKSTNLTAVKIQKSWKIKQKPAGILAWPKIVWAKGLETDCSPLKNPTHWGQTLLSGAGSKLTLKFRPHSKDPIHYTECLWKIKTS